PMNICGQNPIAATVPCGISGAPLNPKTQGPGLDLRICQRPGTSVKPDARAAADSQPVRSVAARSGAIHLIIRMIPEVERPSVVAGKQPSGTLASLLINTQGGYDEQIDRADHDRCSRCTLDGGTGAGACADVSEQSLFYYTAGEGFDARSGDAIRHRAA